MVGKQHVGILTVELVLGGAWQCDVAFHLPWLLACDELGFGELFGVWGTYIVA